MDTCIWDYTSCQIDFFDPLISEFSSATFLVSSYILFHCKFDSALDLNPSRMHGNFISPERLSVETIDGFLAATCNCLITLAPDVYFQRFIAWAKKALCFCSNKKNQTWWFVFLMDWVVDEDDKEAEIGFSNFAMDTVAPSSLYEAEIDKALDSEVFCHLIALYYTEIHTKPLIRHCEAVGPFNIGLILESHLLIIITFSIQ